MISVTSLAERPDLIVAVAELRWREWSYGQHDLAHFVEVTRAETSPAGALPQTLVAVDDSGTAVGVVGLGSVDDELSEAERQDREPWILGMVVVADRRGEGVGRTLLDAVQHVASGVGADRTWVATGVEAVGFYQACRWTVTEHRVLASTGIATTVLARPTASPSTTGAGAAPEVRGSTSVRPGG